MHLKSSQGFTLVEVIISIAILSVCSVVALQLFVTAQNLNTTSRHSDIASVLATNTIENIKYYNTTTELLNQLTSFESAEQGFVQKVNLDENFQVLTPASSDVLKNYVLMTELTLTDQIGLYDIQVTLTDIIENKVLVDYLTAHYFNEEVSYEALP